MLCPFFFATSSVVSVNHILVHTATIAIECTYTEFVSTSWQTIHCLREGEFWTIPKFSVCTVTFIIERIFVVGSCTCANNCPTLLTSFIKCWVNQQEGSILSVIQSSLVNTVSSKLSLVVWNTYCLLELIQLLRSCKSLSQVSILFLNYRSYKRILDEFANSLTVTHIRYVCVVLSVVSNSGLINIVVTFTQFHCSIQSGGNDRGFYRTLVILGRQLTEVLDTIPVVNSSICLVDVIVSLIDNFNSSNECLIVFDVCRNLLKNVFCILLVTCPCQCSSSFLSICEHRANQSVEIRSLAIVEETEVCPSNETIIVTSNNQLVVLNLNKVSFEFFPLVDVLTPPATKLEIWRLRNHVARLSIDAALTKLLTLIPVITPCLTQSLQLIETIRNTYDFLSHFAYIIFWMRHIPLLNTWEVIVPINLKTCVHSVPLTDNSLVCSKLHHACNICSCTIHIILFAPTQIKSSLIWNP